MKHLEEIKELDFSLKKTKELIKQAKTLTFCRGLSQGNGHIFIDTHNSNGYNLLAVEETIGRDKFKEIVQSFEDALSAQLILKLKETEEELSKFNIIKQ